MIFKILLSLFIMNISKEIIITIIALAIIYYTLSEIGLIVAENFDIVRDISKDHSVEDFYAGHGYKHRRRYRRNYYYDPYYSTWYHDPWAYLWSYLPCIDSASGKTYCW